MYGTSSSDINSSWILKGETFGVTGVVGSSPCFFFFLRLFFAFRHNCGSDDGFAGQNKRENRNTFPGLNSGNRSRTVLPLDVVGSKDGCEVSKIYNVNKQ